MPRQILFVESDASVLAYISNMLTAEGYEVITAPSGKEGLIEAWRLRPEMIIIVPELPDLNGLDMTRKLRADQRTSGAKILLLSARKFPQDILAGVQAGADEYIVKRPGADVELIDRVKALLPPEGQAAAPVEVLDQTLGKLIAFLSAKGGTGTSSLCINMAQMLAQQVAPQSVIVADLVLPIGSLSQLVGTTSDQTLVTASKTEARLISPEKIKPMLTYAQDWGLHLLPGSPDPEQAQELMADRLEAVITTLRLAFDYVLVDFGRTLSRLSLPIIRQSARVVLVLGADPATVSLSKTTLKYLTAQDVRASRIYPVLNRAVGLEGLSRGEVEKELGLPIPGIVPHMGSQFTLANNQHVPIATKFPNDTATYVLQDLTTGLLNQIRDDVPPGSRSEAEAGAPAG